MLLVKTKFFICELVADLIADDEQLVQRESCNMIDGHVLQECGRLDPRRSVRIHLGRYFARSKSSMVMSWML